MSLFLYTLGFMSNVVKGVILTCTHKGAKKPFANDTVLRGMCSAICKSKKQHGLKTLVC